MLTRIAAQIRKDLTQFVRDRLALALALILPVVLTALLGSTISLTVTDLPLAVQDLDQTPWSRRYLDAFRASLTFRVLALPTATSPEDALRTGRARAVLVIPPHFERDLQRARPTEAQLLVDATDSNTAQIVRGAAGQVTAAFADELRGASTAVPAIRAELRLWYNPGRQPGKFYGPGMYVLALSIFPTLLAALAMARAGDQQTILQVYVSSLTAHEFLIGKMAAGMVIGVGQCLLALGVIMTLFGLRVVGDPTPFLVASTLFLFCVVSFGTLIGAAIPSQAAAIQIVSVSGFLFSLLLSGLIFPIENIPGRLRWISALVQARYYIVVVRDALLRGGGWPAVWWAVGMIGLLGLAFYALAWRTMRRMQVTT